VHLAARCLSTAWEAAVTTGDRVSWEFNREAALAAGLCGAALR